ncbi:hypothetical protein LTSERUB_4887, partial [Salmonella enterica subsp. enterica serovar Rubislaw str. A4-653]
MWTCSALRAGLPPARPAGASGHEFIRFRIE